MSKEQNTIHIEPIIEQIREQIKRDPSRSQESINPDRSKESFSREKGVQSMNLPEIREQLHQTWNIGQRPFTSHRPVLGKLTVLYKKLLLPLVKLPLCNYLEDQAMFNAAVVQNLDLLFQQHLIERADFLFQQLDKKIETIDAYLHAVKQNQMQLNETISVQGQSLQKEQEKIAQFEQFLNELKDFLFQQLDKKIETIDAHLYAVKQNQMQVSEIVSVQGQSLQKEQEKIVQLEEILAHSEQSLNELKEHINAIRTSLQKDRETLGNHDYFIFNDTFRDSVEVIKQRQSIYLPYFKDCKQVADLGCGRGEFLELLRANNITAIGVDINEEMVAACQSSGLNVQCNNLIDFLSSFPDVSFDGIFSAQVVEHLNISEIKNLFLLIAQKLKPAAYVVIETVNPTSLFSYSHNFLLDVSHRKPLHPNALRFLMERAGLQYVETRFTSPVPPKEMLPNINIPKENSGSSEVTAAWQNLSQMAHRLNEVIFGWQEYAIIGKK